MVTTRFRYGTAGQRRQITPSGEPVNSIYNRITVCWAHCLLTTLTGSLASLYDLIRAGMPRKPASKFPARSSSPTVIRQRRESKSNVTLGEMLDLINELQCDDESSCVLVTSCTRYYQLTLVNGGLMKEPGECKSNEHAICKCM